MRRGGALLALATALLAAGCGTGGISKSGDSSAGKDLFLAKCAGCHTLKDAGAGGKVGPNLDQAKPPRALVVARVTNGKGTMPPFKGQLTAAQEASWSSAHSKRRHRAPAQRSQRSAGEPHWLQSIENGIKRQLKYRRRRCFL